MDSLGSPENFNPNRLYRASVGSSHFPQIEKPRPILAPFRRRLILGDGVAITLAIGIGLFLSSRATTWAIDPTLAIYGVPFAIGVLWWGLLGIRGSYDQRIIGLGTEEVRRVVSASLYLFAVVAGISYLFRADISRSYAFVSFPLGLAFIIAARFMWRSWLHRCRRAGCFMYRTALIGSGQPLADLESHFGENLTTGYQVVVTFPPPPVSAQTDPTKLSEWLLELGEMADDFGVHVVALTTNSTLTSEVIRQIAWHLEGRPIDLLIAPAMMDTGGSRLTFRPAAGFPLLHLSEASLSRPQRFSKRLLDLSGSVLLIILLAPALLVCAIWVKCSSRGPILFRQVRIGRAGLPFTMLKFRSMVPEADAMRDALRSKFDLQDPLFKLEIDPRVTRAGAFLRRWSLDELPQLLNVVGGSMSLVGPRPHPLDDVSRYEIEAFRRLALKPGMTGLWQVEGRSSIQWKEALQLDLYYVESWSLSGDIILLARTFRTVIQGNGAS